MTLITWMALVGSPAWAQETPDEETPSEDTTDETDEAPADEPDQEDIDRAVELFNNGKVLFDEANYTDAIVAWEESYRLSKRPILLFNIASAHERLANYDEAAAALNKYRAFAKAEEKEALDRRVRNLEKLQAEKEAATPAPGPLGPDVPAETSPPRGRAQRLAGAGIIGVGVIGIGAGVGLGLASTAAASRAESSCNDDGLCLDGAKEDIDSNRALAAGADAAFIGGLVLAGTGSVIMLTAPKGQLTFGLSSVRFNGRF